MTPPTPKTLAKPEIEALLRRHNVGRIAFTDGRRVDIEPIGYVYHDGAIYGRAAQGTRMRALSDRPWVAFEVDEIRSFVDWESAVVKGTMYIVEWGPAPAMREQYDKALRLVRSAMPEALTEDDPVPARTILFRIHIDEMEGRAATPADHTGADGW